MTAAKKKFATSAKIGIGQAALQAEEAMVDEQVSRIYAVLENNHGRILDLHDRLGGPFPRSEGEVPDDKDKTILSVLDHILARLCSQQDIIETIHEHIGSKIGRIKLY